MKRLFALFTLLAFCLTLPATAFAAGTAGAPICCESGTHTLCGGGSLPTGCPDVLSLHPFG